MFTHETCRKGFVLLLTLVIMMTLSSIAAALIFSLTTDFRNAVVQSNDAKAFWLAEAGIQDAAKRLKNDEINISDGSTDSTSIQNISLGGGIYSVTLSRTGSDITLTSTGTHGGQTRTVKQVQVLTLKFPAAFDYAVFGSNSTNATLTIAGGGAGATISGDLFYDRPVPVDSVIVRANSKVINGLVYTDTISGAGTYTLASGDPSPVPSYPVFSTATYDAAITIADSAPRPDFTLSGSSTLNLAGGTVYYRNFTAQNTSTVIGPGTIVVTRDVLVRNSAIIGSNVKIIAKRQITVRDTSKINSGSVLYARRRASLIGSAIVNTSLIVPVISWGVSNVVIQNSVILTGIVFTDSLDVFAAANIKGSIVANRFHGNAIDGMGVKITFNSTYIPTTVPAGFATREVYSKKANSWDEV